MNSHAPEALAALWLNASSGDREALADLYDRLAPCLYGVAHSVLHDTDEAADVVVGVFADLVSERISLRTDPVTTLVFVTRRFAVNRLHVRHRSAVPSWVVPRMPALHVPGLDADAVHRALSRAEHQALATVMGRMRAGHWMQVLRALSRDSALAPPPQLRDRVLALLPAVTPEPPPASADGEAGRHRADHVGHHLPHLSHRAPDGTQI